MKFASIEPEAPFDQRRNARPTSSLRRVRLCHPGVLVHRDAIGHDALDGSAAGPTGVGLPAGLAEAGAPACGEIRVVFDMTAGTDRTAGAVIAEDLA